MKAAELECIVRDSLEKKLAAVCSAGANTNPRCHENDPVILAAVSGGVDSMVMLSLLHAFSCGLSYKLHVITVNHNIRPAEETAGDAALVKEYCRKLSVPCTVAELKRNEVAETALERGGGTEEAARFLRYQAFEQAADACGADLVCIAHNRNDRLETVLERFFQGARAGSASGMKQSRGRFFRPLFELTRADIEAYAAENAVPFRTDATNADNSYYRNRIRNELMPLLDSLFPGWDTAVLHGAEKNALIAAALEKHASAVKAEPAAVEDHAAVKTPAAGKACASVSFDAAQFDALEIAERIEVLYQALYRIGTEKRVPWEMLRSFTEGRTKAEGAGVVLARERGCIIIKKTEQTAVDGFYCLVRECGRYSMPWGEILIREDDQRVGKNAFRAENIENGALSGTFPLPLVIRSRQPSDRIRAKDGGHKEVSKLFSEWHIPDRYQPMLPVLEGTEVLGVWGSVFGYPDYFVTPAEERE